MPTYEYKCTKCGHAFETFQSITEASVESCPECQGAVEKIISGGAGLIFKGSGFYITDYKKKSDKKESTSDSKPSESKPKTDSPAKPSTDPKPSKNTGTD